MDDSNCNNRLSNKRENTYGASGVEIEYFVTNKGDIFTWPPYYRSDDGLFYVNDVIPVAGSKVTSGDWIISGDDESKMYEDEFKFMVNGLEIKIQGTGEALPPVTMDTPIETIKNMASIGYKDERNPEEPKGVESESVYQDDGTSGGGSNGSVVENSIVAQAKVGDYVNYSANGVTSWRVFDIQNGEVLITPASGPVGTLKLSRAKGYLTAVTEIEKKCDDYINSSLGVTESNVRSMTVEDINRASRYTPPVSTRYAYYLNSDTTYTSGTVDCNGKTYTKTKHTATLNNGWTEPRFYTWDSATNVSGDENGIRYAYPTKENPVYVTRTYYNYDPSRITHVNSTEGQEIRVGSLLGDNYGWLASPCVNTISDYAYFRVYFAKTSYVNACALVGSDGNFDSPSYGVRPLVSLGSNIKATRIDDSSPWILSK